MAICEDSMCCGCVENAYTFVPIFRTTYAEFSFPSLNIYSDPRMEEYFILAGTNLPFSVF